MSFGNINNNVHLSILL